MVPAGAAALALAGVIVKGVVWPVTPCVGMWTHTLTLTSNFVKLVSMWAGSLPALAPTLITIPVVPMTAPLVVATLTTTSVIVHPLWKDTGCFRAHTSASSKVCNFLPPTMQEIFLALAPTLI